MLFHGMLMGVAVEGINFYGIGELSLFLCNNSSTMSIGYMIPIISGWSILSIILLYWITKSMKAKSELKHRKRNRKLYSVSTWS